MPRLSHPRLTKGEAITCLLDLYWAEPNFARELQQLRQPYSELLAELARAQVKFWLDCRQALPTEEYKRVLHDFYYEYTLKRGKVPKLPSSLSHQLEQIEERFQKLQPYLDGLAELAYKWKLRARWTIFALVWYDIIQIIPQAFELPKEIDIPLDAFDDWQPRAVPAPPLVIKVSSLAYVYLSREQIIERIAKQVREYEARIKDAGLREHPSALEKHTRWWFAHYVRGLTWSQIADEIAEVDAKGGPQPENIRKAVIQFSKLIGIRPENN